MVTLITLILVTLVVSFVCSLLESTLLSTPISFLTMKEDEGSKAATRFLEFKQDIDRPLSAILIVNTIANTLGAAAIGATAANLAPDPAGVKTVVGIVSTIMTIAILFFAEILPKTLGTNYGKNFIGFTVSTISLMIFITYPLVLLANWFTKIVSRDEDEALVSRDEVSAIVSAGVEEGEIEQNENKIIQNVLKLDSVLAYDVMTPRIVCSCAPENMTLRQFYKDDRFLHHSRIPVYDGSIENITGYVLRSEALEMLADDKFDVRLKDIKRSITFFNEDVSIGLIWEKLLEKKEQICLVANEYGSFLGIITLEDIIETIFGLEIIDELDEATDMQQFARERWEKRQKKYAKIEYLDNEDLAHDN